MAFFATLNHQLPKIQHVVLPVYSYPILFYPISISRDLPLYHVERNLGYKSCFFYLNWQLCTDEQTSENHSQTRITLTISSDSHEWIEATFIYYICVHIIGSRRPRLIVMCTTSLSPVIKKSSVRLPLLHY